MTSLVTTTMPIHALQAGAYLLLGERSALELVASYKDALEIRGTGLTQAVDPASDAFPQDTDRYTNGQFNARYTYGVSHTGGLVALEASTQKLPYQNNLVSTRQFDRDDSYGLANSVSACGREPSLEPARAGARYYI
jgi:hypothetical protein